MSSVSKELLKNVVNKFTTSGHSYDSSYLIVKYFIGLNTNKIDNYNKKIQRLLSSKTSNIDDCDKK